MAKKILLTLTDQIYESLAREARDHGEELKRFIARQLDRKSKRGSRKAGVSARLRRFFGIVKTGDGHGSNNERIDADIAAEILRHHDPRKR